MPARSIHVYVIPSVRHSARDEAHSTLCDIFAIRNCGRAPALGIVRLQQALVAMSHVSAAPSTHPLPDCIFTTGPQACERASTRDVRSHRAVHGGARAVPTLMQSLVRPRPGVFVAQVVPDVSEKVARNVVTSCVHRNAIAKRKYTILNIPYLARSRCLKKFENNCPSEGRRLCGPDVCFLIRHCVLGEGILYPIGTECSVLCTRLGA